MNWFVAQLSQPLLKILCVSILPPLVIALIAGFFVRRISTQVGFVDRPDARKSHARPTALGGGIAIWLALVLTFGAAQLLLLSLPSDWLQQWGGEFYARHAAGLWHSARDLWFVLVCGTVLAALGLWDDVRGLPWQFRLGVQFAVAGAIVWRGWTLSAFLDAPWLMGVLTILWIVTLINSFNMLDNMDALSAGVGAIASAMLAAVLLQSTKPGQGEPQWFVAIYLLVLCGALVGFLFHNRPPARLFMGDAGSYLIGFWIAVGTILATFNAQATGQPRHTILAPLCILAVPLYDLVSVICIRLSEGRSPFQADRRHFSHRLVAGGLSRTTAVLTIQLITFTTGLSGLLLYYVQTWTGAGLVVLSVLCLILLIAVLEHRVVEESFQEKNLITKATAIKGKRRKR